MSTWPVPTPKGGRSGSSSPGNGAGNAAHHSLDLSTGQFQVLSRTREILPGHRSRKKRWSGFHRSRMTGRAWAQVFTADVLRRPTPSGQQQSGIEMRAPARRGRVGNPSRGEVSAVHRQGDHPGDGGPGIRAAAFLVDDGETVSGAGGAWACRQWETRVREGRRPAGVGLDVDAVAVVGEAVDEDDRTAPSRNACEGRPWRPKIRPLFV